MTALHRRESGGGRGQSLYGVEEVLSLGAHGEVGAVG